MNSSKTPSPDQNKQLTVLGQFIGDIQQILPDTVKKNVLKAGNRLIFGAVDVPIAWMEQFSRRIRRKTETMDMIQKGESKAISKLLEEDSVLAQETLNFNSLKEYKAFFNRQKVMETAMNELRNNPPKEDTDQEIDEDWLEMFSRTVEAISQEGIQLIFSKILSGEIHKPGSFSRKTIQILSLVDQHCAQLFLDFCGSYITIKPNQGPLIKIVIKEVIDKSNWTEQSSFTMEAQMGVLVLQENGLVYPNSFEIKSPISYKGGFLIIGDTNYSIKIQNSRRNSVIKFNTYYLTATGKELFKVISPTLNPGTIRYKYLGYLRGFYDVE